MSDRPDLPESDPTAGRTVNASDATNPASGRGRGGTVGLAVVALTALLLAGCSTPSSGDPTSDDAPASTQPSTTSAAAAPAPEPSQDPPVTDPAEPDPSGEPTETPVAIANYFDRAYSGTDLRIGNVRERTDRFTSHEVTYRSENLLVSGVLNVPEGDGPFPAVVLLHGWIDRDSYVSGQGMTRERGYLADDGYITLHVDYRDHAGSDDDPALVRNMYLGYAVDAINAVNALRASDDIPLDDDRVALMGRSMGGQVVLQALEMAPGLVSGGIVYSGQSSLEADNYRRWAAPGSAYAAEAADLYGTPDENPDFWTGISTRPEFGRITEPVLMIHATEDEQCPAVWAEDTFAALQDAGVDSEIEWYEGESHAFGPRFEDSMDRSAAFLEEALQ